MTTQQQIPETEMESLQAAVNFLNSISRTPNVVIESTTPKDGVVLVTIDVPDEYWFFALAVQYGRYIEKHQLRETMKIMFEELKD